MKSTLAFSHLFQLRKKPTVFRKMKSLFFKQFFVIVFHFREMSLEGISFVLCYIRVFLSHEESQRKEISKGQDSEV